MIIVPESAVVLEPRKFFDDAMSGILTYPDGSQVVAYSETGLVKAIMDMCDCPWDEALEYFHYNTKRSLDYIDNKTRPVIIEDDVEDTEDECGDYPG